MGNCVDLLTKQNNDLVVKFGMKRKPAFKAGAELSSKVNLVAIDVNEELIEDSEVFEMNIKIERSAPSGCDITIEAIQEKQKELEVQLKCLAQLAETKKAQEQNV